MKTFNLIIGGCGGQGIITIAEIISKAALKQGFDVKEAELHGLAQRGGSLNCHVRFGSRVYSPLVTQGSADLIIALEALEALRACYWANKDTQLLINSKTFNSPLELKQIIAKINSITKHIHLIDADAEAKKLTGDIMNANIFMLGAAIKKGLLPLKKMVVWKAIEERLHKRFLEQSKKVFEGAFKK